MNNLIDKGIKFNAIIADVPYGTTKCKWDSVLDLNIMWDKINRLKLNKQTPVLLFAQCPFDKILGSSNIKEMKYEWIWEKTSATGHLNAKKMPMKAHENILVFYNSPPIYNPQKTKGHERKISKAVHKVNCIESDVYNKGQKLTTYDSTERYPRSVLKIKTDKQKFAIHPTQKPVELYEYFVKTYTNEQDSILDFTMGSGGLGVACNRLNRKFTGIDNGYCQKKGDFFGKSWTEIAKYRIENNL